MGDPNEQRGTDKPGTADNKSGDRVVRGVLLVAPGRGIPVMSRSDYIDKVFTKLMWNPILHTYILEFERGGKTRWVEVGADELGWNEWIRQEHPIQFFGWTKSTKMVTPYNFYKDPLGAIYASMEAQARAAKIDKEAAKTTSFVSFYRETPERGGVIVPTEWTRTTAPELFAALLQLHGNKPISVAQREAWMEVGDIFAAGSQVVLAISMVRSLTPTKMPLNKTPPTVPAESSIVKAARAISNTARAAKLEIQFAVTQYGVSQAAVAYLGRSAFTFYLRNAVKANTAIIVGADIVITLGGGDMGPVSPADSVDFVVKGEKAVRNAIKTGDDVVVKAPKVVANIRRGDVLDFAVEEKGVWYKVKAEVDTVEKAPEIVVKVKDVKRSTSEDAAKYFDSGKLVHHSKKAIQAAPPLPPSNIHLRELLSKEQVENLVKKGFRKEAVEKLQHMEIGELERIGLITKKDYDDLRSIQKKISEALASQKTARVASLQKEESKILKKIETAGLYKKLQSSASTGGAVRDFINEFWQKPGFQEVVMNWAKGGISQQGTNFLMKYSLAKFKNKAIRFEWGAGIKKTTGGQDTWARYVDIVVDGGTDIRPGEALRIEMKKWTDFYLSSSKARDTITRQLARDTAFFTRHNIKWVFDSSQRVTHRQVIDTFVDIILKDPFLKEKWGGTKQEIEAVLKNIIEIYPP